MSSYFMTTKYYKQDNIKFNKEFAHRLKRLYPAYILLIIVASLLYIIVKRQFPCDIPIFLFSGQNFFWILGNMFDWGSPLSGILAHTWYITLDVYLFILWILVIKYAQENRLRVICYAGIVTAVAWRVMCNLLFDDKAISYTIPIGQLDSYCIGALIALNKTSDFKSKFHATINIGTGLILIIMCVLFVSYTRDLNFIQSYQFFAKSSNYTHNPILVNIYLFSAILFAGILQLCLQVGKNSILCKSWMVTLGNWSYELYLFHFPFIWILSRFITTPYLMIIIALPLTLLSAYIWHRYVEGHIQTLIN